MVIPKTIIGHTKIGEIKQISHYSYPKSKRKN